jgi:hypothetical protein
VCVLLLRMRVLALPDVPGQVAKHSGEVMVAPATGRGDLAKLAAADYAAESLTLSPGVERGAAPKRGAWLLGHRT